MFSSLLFVVVVLFCGSGEHTASSCNVSISVSDESVLRKLLEEQSRNFSSAIAEINKTLNAVLDQVNQSLRCNQSQADTGYSMGQNCCLTIEKINGKVDAILDQVNENLQCNVSQVLGECKSDVEVCDCSDIKSMGYMSSGVYRLFVFHQGERINFTALCDMTTAKGPWTVFQRRMDGKELFYRGWDDYANGFGYPCREHWLGNKFLHLLTSKRKYRMRIDLGDWEGGKQFAEYSTFNISSSKDNYRLTVNGTSGDAGDSFDYHNGFQFSTKDADHDRIGGNCAVILRGGWWYSSCTLCNLNGLYYRGDYLSGCSGCSQEGITWWPLHDFYYSLKTTKMQISST